MYHMPHPEEPQQVHDMWLSPPPPEFILMLIDVAHRSEILWVELHPSPKLTDEPSLNETV